MVLFTTNVWRWRISNFRIQVRYGQHWAPIHPGGLVGESMTEILLTPGEVFVNLRARTGVVIGFVEFTSIFRSYPPVGVSAYYNKFVPLNGLLYFSGAAGDYMGIRVTQLVAHRDTCQSDTSWTSWSNINAVAQHLPKWFTFPATPISQT